MPFERGRSGNPAGAPVGSRHRQQLNGEFVAALLRDFRQGGPAAIAKMRKKQPSAYCKLLALLCPRDFRVESGGVKALSDEQLETAIAMIEGMLEARSSNEAKLVEATAETVALPAPDVISDGPNKVMDAADTAVWPRDRKPRKRVPSPSGA